MNKFICAALLSAAVATTLSAKTLRDYAPGKLPSAKNVKFAMSKEGVLSMEFGEGNLKGSRAWMRRHHDFIPVGKALKISIQVKTTGMSDDDKVGFMVQALGEGRKYLRSQIFIETYPANDFKDKWGTMEFIFKMPDPARAVRWKDGKMLMITFDTYALKGKAEFKDFKAEITDAPLTLSELAPGKLPAAKNVKFAVKNNVSSMTFGPGNAMGARAWMRQYHPMLKVGQKLRITMKVRTTDMMDPRSKVGYLVQTLGENNKYLASRPYMYYTAANEFDGEWKTLEYLFTMPDPEKTPNWKNGKILMISYETIALEGKAEFKDFKAEVVAQ